MNPGFFVKKSCFLPVRSQAQPAWLNLLVNINKPAHGIAADKELEGGSCRMLLKPGEQ